MKKYRIILGFVTCIFVLSCSEEEKDSVSEIDETSICESYSLTGTNEKPIFSYRCSGCHGTMVLKSEKLGDLLINLDSNHVILDTILPCDRVALLHLGKVLKAYEGAIP